MSQRNCSALFSLNTEKWAIEGLLGVFFQQNFLMHTMMTKVQITVTARAERTIAISSPRLTAASFWISGIFVSAAGLEVVCIGLEVAVSKDCEQSPWSFDPMVSVNSPAGHEVHKVCPARLW